MLLALAQVLLQKAKAEPLNDQSMLDVFKWLKLAAGTLTAAVSAMKDSGPAPKDHTPRDLQNGLLPLLVDCSLAQVRAWGTTHKKTREYDLGTVHLPFQEFS